MEECIVRMRIPKSLHNRYKIACLKNKLSLPKQTAELIRKFVEVREIDDTLAYECSKKTIRDKNELV